VSLECEPERAEAAIRAVWAQVAAVRDGGVAASELDRIRTLLQARLLRRLETAEGQANVLAEWQALGDWRKVADYLDGVRSLSPDDLRTVARRYLDPARATLLAYRPDDGTALGWTDADLPEALDGGDPVTAPSAPTGDGAPAFLPAELGDPRIEDGVVIRDMGGGRLVTKHRSRSPLVTLAVMRRGGVLHEDPAVAGITNLMVRSTLKGTAARSAAAIAIDSERLGGGIGVSAGPDLLSWSMTVPAEHFAAGARLLADVALRPSFPAAEVERERDVLLADLDGLRDDMYRYPLRLMLKAAFDGHPYGHGPGEIAAAVGELDPDDLRRWHEEELAPPWVFVVGDVEAERAADVASDLFGVGSGAWSPEEPAVEWPEAPRVESVRRDRAQSARAVAFPGPSRTHPDRSALHVLGNAVSGLGNRLFEELRSRRSLAYTVAAYPVVRRHAGAFVGYIATTPDRADEARAGLVEELLRLRDEPPAEEDVERSRRYTIGAWQIRTQTNAAQLSELAGALLLGHGLEEIRTFEDRIRGVSRDQLREAAARWFDPERLVEGVVHGV
jgi:zinc protease